MLLAQYRGLAELRHRIRLFLAFSERDARAAGVEPQQHQLLLAMKGLPEGERATVRALAGRLLLKHHSVVELADRLERRGLIARRASTLDRRETLLCITATGERLLRKLSVTHQNELRSEGGALMRALEMLLAPAVVRKKRKRGAS